MFRSTSGVDVSANDGGSSTSGSGVAGAVTIVVFVVLLVAISNVFDPWATAAARLEDGRWDFWFPPAVALLAAYVPSYWLGRAVGWLVSGSGSQR